MSRQKARRPKGRAKTPSRAARTARAAAVVAAVTFAPACANALAGILPGAVVWETASALRGEGPAQNGVSAGERPSMLDASGALGREGTIAGLLGEDIVPSGDGGSSDGAAESTIARDLFSLEGKEDVRISEDGAVVGYLSDADAIAAYETAASELEGTGWTCVSEGSGTAGSFAKDEGAFSLCYVSCVDVAGRSAVVVQCVFAE